MEIWVRSQDKKWFGEVKGFAVSEVSYNNTTYCAICKDNLAGRELGRYSSKKRCIEIIDEIQKIMADVVIYEMPKE